MRNVLRTLVLLWFVIAPAFSLMLIAQPPTMDMRTRISAYQVGENVKLKLVNGSKLEGKIIDIRPDVLEVAPKHAQQHRKLSYAQIRTVHSHNSIGSRLRMGPCVGPVTLAIAAPIVAAMYAFGH